MSGAPRLTLSVRNAAALGDGVVGAFAISERNAIIGRSPTADWTLPDPRAFVSSRHCEITYANGEYRLADVSMNGTLLNGSGERMRGPHILCDGDRLTIGPYEIVVAIEGGAPPPAVEPLPQSEWSGWNAPAAPEPVPSAPGWGPPTPGAGAAPASAPGWGPAVPGMGSNGGGADGWSVPSAAVAPSGSPAAPPPSASGGWGASAAPLASTPPATGSGGSPWDFAAPTGPAASAWSDPNAAPSAAPAAENAWGKFASSYSVDWGRGGFDPPAEPAALPEQNAFAPPPVSAPTTPPANNANDRRAVSRRSADTALAQFLAAAGLDPALIKNQEPEVMAMAGNLLRRLIAGLVVMMEARARAKAQMGAQSTIFGREGSNPIKFARTPESALAQLLNPPIGGYMTSERAIEDSFRDLQLHQMATLKAMQGALGATLARFSPDAIKKRADDKGLLKRIMPGAREAALWRAYEREFGGVAQGSDEAFMDIFAKEFRRAYDEQAAKMN